MDVTSVGEVLIDLVAPEAESLATACQFIPTPGGAPANVAVAVARLGGRAAFVGAVGRDPFGNILRRALGDAGVSCSSMVSLDRHTSLAFVARNPGGIPDFIFYRDADAALREEDLPIELLNRSRFVFLSSMALMSEPSRSTTLRAARLAQQSSALVAVDPNLRPTSWPDVTTMLAATRPLLTMADVLKMNETEAALITDDRDPERGLMRLSSSCRLAIITLGANGCIWRHGTNTGRLHAPRVAVEDTTGAGDAFMGALLAALASDSRDRPLEEISPAVMRRIMHFAVTAASISCTRLGAMASLPTQVEVQEAGGGQDSMIP